MYLPRQSSEGVSLSIGFAFALQAEGVDEDLQSAEVAVGEEGEQEGVEVDAEK